jgi:mono/diheme cytochrome c family protein
VRNRELAIGLVLMAVGLLGLFVLSYQTDGDRSPMHRGSPRERSDRSRERALKADIPNGERIYLYGVSESRKPIEPRLDGMGGHMVQGYSCADCHGEERQGGRVDLMMGSYDVPDLQVEHLAEHGFTEEALKIAITDGVKPDGQPLEFPMPRWSMADEDLDDLVQFLLNP